VYFLNGCFVQHVQEPGGLRRSAKIESGGLRRSAKIERLSATALIQSQIA
jgi:hypothetical protein